MTPPKVYIDTTVFKSSATQLPRLLPREKTINWGGKYQKIIVYTFSYINPNDAIANNNLKNEISLLTTLAEAGKHGEVKYVVQDETIFECWGLPKMDSRTGIFYGTPIEHVEAPIEYSRVLNGPIGDAKCLQFSFLSSIKNSRFLKLQKMTGAYQGPGKLNRNQLLDAFHIWCAEHNKCDFFLTLDLKLVNMLRGKKPYPLVEVVKPSELINKIGIST